LLPASSLPIKGEISLINRIEHSKSKGTKWMASGEMDLMLSILSSDGRYEDLAYILPYTDSATVRTCYAKHRSYQDLVNLMNENQHITPDELDELIVGRFKASKQSIQAEYLEHTKHLLKRVIVPNLGMMEKKILVFPSNLTDAHWTVTFVFNASYIQHDIEADVDSGWLQPCFFRYCSLVTDGSRQTSTEEGIPWFLNFCYSYELHERMKQNSSEPMKWYAPYGSSSDEQLLGSRNFPALRLRDRSHLPHQKDGFNCGVGACTAIGIVLRNYLKNENNASWFLSKLKREEKDMVFLKDESTLELYMMFPEDFFEPVPTKSDLVWGNYLDCLREEWFILFDRMAHIQYITLPQRINRQNAVDPIYYKTLKALTWPDKEERAKRTIVSRRKAIVKMESMKKNLPGVGSTSSKLSTLPHVSQTQDSPDKAMGSNDAELHAANDNDAKDDKTIAIKKDDQALIVESFTSGDGTSSFPFTKAIITDPEKLKPVRFHMRIKKRKGDLLERLKLNRVKFSDDEHDGLEANDDPESPFYKIDEVAKKQKVSTLTTKTIDAFRHKYHTMLENDDEVQAITPEFTTALDEFITTSLAKWNWSSDEGHMANIMEWVDEMKQKDCSLEQKAYIKRLIKGIKEERAHYKSQLTNEFMFTRPTMVRGLRYAKENNSFYARLVYREIDKKNPAKLVDGRKEINYVNAEEEIKVEEEWVRNEYNDEVVQHVINMNQSNNWVDVPKDVEVRIAKKKVVRVRYVAEHNRYVLDYDKMAKRIRSRDIKDRKRRRLLGFTALPNSAVTSDSKQRIERVATGKTPTKGAQRSIVNVIDAKEMEKKQMEEEDAIWSKNIIRKAVPMAAKWSGRMENGKETILEEDFVVMAFGDAYVKELKMSPGGWVDVPVGDYKPSHLHEHPNLKVIGAPKVNFNQSDGKDLCVSKSFASALYAIGFAKEAVEIDLFGEEIMKGAVVNALDKVIQHARTVLPSWIVIRSIKKHYDWTQELDERQMLVVVLHASDESCCHAVTIHGGFVFDANETIALPLCNEALNYCTSTSLVKSEFVDFRRGYILKYEGTKKSRIAKMTLQL
jgi:hypothetical protein